MKASFFSFVAAVALLVTTAASAAPLDHDRTTTCVGCRPANEFAWNKPSAPANGNMPSNALEEAQHHHDRGPARPYGYR
jgi:hypothetical protein